MSRGLGLLQREIKEVLAILWRTKSPTRFDEIALGLLLRYDGAEDIWFERSARRALDGLLKRGDVVVIGGRGTSSSPRHFMCVEDFARLSGKKPRNTADAKKIAAGVPLTLRPMVVAELRGHRAARSRRRSADRGA